MRELEGNVTRSGVEQDDVTYWARLAIQDAADDPGVVRRIASKQIRNGRAGDTEIARVKVVLVHIAAADFPNVAVSGGRQFVEAVVTTEHQCGGTARLEHSRHQRRLLDVGNTDSRSLGPGRVAERTEEVKHSRHAELTANRACMPEAEVEFGRKHEGQTNFLEDRRHLLRFQVELHAERAEHIR